MGKKKKKEKGGLGPNLPYWETTLGTGQLTHRKCGGLFAHPIRRKFVPFSPENPQATHGRPRCLECGAWLGRKAWRTLQGELEVGILVQKIEPFYVDGHHRRLWAFYNHANPPEPEAPPQPEQPCEPEEAPREDTASSSRREPRWVTAYPATRMPGADYWYLALNRRYWTRDLADEIRRLLSNSTFPSIREMEHAMAAQCRMMDQPSGPGSFFVTADSYMATNGSFELQPPPENLWGDIPTPPLPPIEELPKRRDPRFVKKVAQWIDTVATRIEEEYEN